MCFPTRDPLLRIVLGALLAICALPPRAAAHGGHAHGDEAAQLHPVSAVFDRDGRLWRVTTDGEHVWVDRSDDHARSFSAPTRVTRAPHPIKAQPEIRPQIAITSDGAIHVSWQHPRPALYSGDVTWSVSRDGGRSFSVPRPLNDDRQEVGHSFHAMAAGAAGELWVAWLDDRDGNDPNQPGGRPAARGLYYARLDPAGISPGAGAPAANHRVAAKHVCDCCRVAIAATPSGEALIFTRLALADGDRDHALVRVGRDGPRGALTPLTRDGWRLDACPHHGPAVAVDGGGRAHLAWFTQGEARKGLFYAASDDGAQLSPPLALAPEQPMAGHPDVLARGEEVFVVWITPDENERAVWVRRSADRGRSFGPARRLATAKGPADYPFLLGDGTRVWVSWQTLQGYRLIAVP